MGLLLLEAVVLGVAALLRRPDITRNEAFLFADQSLNLLVAQELASGGRLYADVFSPYGPAPAYLHTLAATIWGNTILSYNLLLFAITLFNVALAYVLLRAHASTRLSMLIIGVGLVPTILIPGSLVGSISGSPYVPLERSLLLAAALAWRPPGSRTALRSGVVGGLLGIWQWVKFGGAFFVGAAIILLDLLIIAMAVDRRSVIRPWLWSLTLALAAFLALESIRAAVMLGLLPLDVAVDVLWPAYHLETYDGWVTRADRWPTWGGWRTFVGQYLTPAIALLVTAGGALWYFGPGRARSGAIGGGTEDLRLLLPAIFLLIAMAAYLPSAHQIRQFLWVLPIGAAFWLIRAGPQVRALVIALWIPCLALNAKVFLVNPPDPAFVPVDLPTGDRLWARADLIAQLEEALDEARRLRSLRTASPGREMGGEPYVLFVPMAAGVHATYDIPPPSRQPWLVPGFVRPYDEGDLLQAFDDLSAVVVQGWRDTGERSASGCDWIEPSPFSEAFCQRVDPLIGEPHVIGSHFTLFPIRAGGGDRVRENDGTARAAGERRPLAGRLR